MFSGHAKHGMARHAFWKHESPHFDRLLKEGLLRAINPSYLILSTGPIANGDLTCLLVMHSMPCLKTYYGWNGVWEDLTCVEI